eukprot:424367-Prorocentrum_minimum.AAC.2
MVGGAAAVQKVDLAPRDPPRGGGVGPIWEGHSDGGGAVRRLEGERDGCCVELDHCLVLVHVPVDEGGRRRDKNVAHRGVHLAGRVYFHDRPIRFRNRGYTRTTDPSDSERA